MQSKEELLSRLSDRVCDMEDDEVVDVVKEYIVAGYDPQEGMLEGLVDGMKRASVLYEEGEYFVPELIVCSDAMYAGIEEFQKYLPDTEKQSIGKVAIGVVEGDTHDIGKNLVGLMLRNYGYKVIDLGKDVPAGKIIETALCQKASVVGLSALMTTTMMHMKDVIAEAADRHYDGKIIIGGAAVTPSFSDEIGADGYSKDAADCVKLVSRLLS